MKKKTLSFCLIGLIFLGTTAFAASSVSQYCSLTGKYTAGTSYTATGTTTAPSNGLVYSDHVWNYINSNEETTKSIYLYN